jgi:hypothetical protein
LFLNFYHFLFLYPLHSWKYAHIRSSPLEWTNRTTQHRKTNTNIHPLIGIRTHATDRAATVTSITRPQSSITRLGITQSPAWWRQKNSSKRHTYPS